MTADTDKDTSRLAFYRQTRERSVRVGWVRKLSRWASKIETVQTAVSATKRTGHNPPTGWLVDYDVLLAKLRDCRDYLLSAIASGTESSAPDGEGADK